MTLATPSPVYLETYPMTPAAPSLNNSYAQLSRSPSRTRSSRLEVGGILADQLLYQFMKIGKRWQLRITPIFLVFS